MNEILLSSLIFIGATFVAGLVAGLVIGGPKTAVEVWWRRRKQRKLRPDVKEAALKTAQVTLGHDDPNTVSPLNEVAEAYSEIGDFRKAERLLKQALAINEKAMGSENPALDESLYRLADLYTSWGKYTTVEACLERVMELTEKRKGVEHMDLVGPLWNLAHFYDSRQKDREAESLVNRVLEIQKKALGPEHTEVANSLAGLARFYGDKGRDEEAECLILEALEMKQRVLGADHAEVADSLAGLSGFYAEKGKDEEAERCLVEALEMKQRVLGPGHTEVADSLTHLGWFYANKSREDEAELLLKQALAIKEKALGPEHPGVAAGLIAVGLFYVGRGMDQEADHLLQQALEIKEKAVALGDNYVDHLYGAANFYDTLVRHSDARRFLQWELEIREKELHPNHPTLRALRINIDTYGEKERTQRSEDINPRPTRRGYFLRFEENRVTIDAPRETVWSFIERLEKLTEWWPQATFAFGQLSEGKEFDLVKYGNRIHCRVLIHEVDPQRKVVFLTRRYGKSNPGTRTVLTLNDTKNGTRVRFSKSFFWGSSFFPDWLVFLPIRLGAMLVMVCGFPFFEPLYNLKKLVKDDIRRQPS